MSISTAFNSALSGLTANSRLTDVISGNLANALTPGYAPRELGLEARGVGGGVSATGVTRQIDPVLLGDRRLADSGLADAQTRAGFAASLERAIGTPGEGNSLGDRLTALETAVSGASARPEDDVRLGQVLREAQALGSALNTASRQIETLRTRADGEIATTVETLNSGLEQVAGINARIVSARAGGHETASLEDRRQAVIDDLSKIVPLRQLDRAGGAVALVSTGGALLLDGRAAELDFTKTPRVAAHMTLGNGLLSGLELDGRPASASPDGPLGGGRLSALFRNRDELGLEAQRGLDAVAAGLIDRVEGLTPAPAPGLFTDAGARFDPADEAGIAGRIALNPAVDPESGGALSRLRTGPETAPGSGAVASAPYLEGLSTALAQPRSGAPGDPARTLPERVAALSGQIAQERLSADSAVSFSAGQANELRELELRGGVDSDAELQRLLLVEQAFTANARMVQTLDDMMQTLLRI